MLFTLPIGGHVGHASVDKYKKNSGRHWKGFFYGMANDWEKMNLDWYLGFAPNLRIVLFYEQMIENPDGELRRLLDFLGAAISNTTMKCVMDKKEGIYKRAKRLLSFNPFDESMKRYLDERRNRVYNILKGGELISKTELKSEYENITAIDMGKIK